MKESDFYKVSVLKQDKQLLESKLQKMRAYLTDNDKPEIYLGVHQCFPKILFEPMLVHVSDEIAVINAKLADLGVSVDD